MAKRLTTKTVAHPVLLPLGEKERSKPLRNWSSPPGQLKGPTSNLNLATRSARELWPTKKQTPRKEAKEEVASK
jgi:hypothetical protein